MLRTALVWSLITGTPFRMFNIRAGRGKSGLKAQHVQVLKSLLPLGPVEFTGASVGSSVVTFTPARLKGNRFETDIGTAGSVTLLLQTLLPVVLLAEGASRIVIQGGTDVEWSPSFDYWSQVALEPAAAFAQELKVHLERRGFYPRGGGRLLLEACGGRRAEPLEWTERGALDRIRILSVASSGLVERRVAERQCEAAADRLRRYGVPVDAKSSYDNTLSPGSVVTCVAEFSGGRRVGGCALGARQKRSEDVGREAADRLRVEIDSGAPVDEHAADQLIVWMGMSGGAMRTSRVTEHTRTGIWVAEHFLGKAFEVEGDVIRSTRPLPWGKGLNS